ncbi:hypothetical protein [Actinopolymorpha sp. B17G11]|uniref:hypothetical protein n=1 Tax=Actinopolymorpha sp. B17G11 TaxID=3160861 RepID=UPI0032E39BD3
MPHRPRFLLELALARVADANHQRASTSAHPIHLVLVALDHSFNLIGRHMGRATHDLIDN